jgi:hypothetical protein
MVLHEAKVVVLARIPNLGQQTPNSDEDDDAFLSESGGRLIRQALSFKLLAGLTLCLLVVAVVPFPWFGQPSSATEPSVADDSVGSWQSDLPATRSDATTQLDTPRQATLVRAAPELSPGHDSLARPQAERPQRASPPPADGPLMSKWPNPLATARTQNSPATDRAPSSVAPPATVWPVDYQADARGGQRPQRPPSPTEKQ